MDWPGNGDPYYTPEGGIRKDFYGVSYVPWLQAEGAFCATSTAAAQIALDDALAAPAFASLVAAHAINGTEISVDVSLLPYANYENFVVHIVVFENVTTGNVATNGETEFHHVMMKMLPDAYGTAINVNDREPFAISETFDLAGTNVEGFDDLGVGVVFQNTVTGEIFQSIYSVEDGVFAAESRASELYADGSPVAGFDPDVTEYIIDVPAGSSVPEVTGTTMDENAIMIVENALVIPGNTYVDVFAEDLQTHTRYTLGWDMFIGVDEPRTTEIKTYPNPSNGILNIYGAENANIQVYSITGKLVTDIPAFTGHRADFSTLPSGVYFMKIIAENNTVITKKITIR